MNFDKTDQLKKNTQEKPKPIRYRKCRYCKEKTVPYGSINPFCFSNKCIKEHNETTRKKSHAKAVKQFKSGDIPHLTKVAQQTVNKYTRLRDRDSSCISCNMPSGFRQEAGHYRSAGNNRAIRFHTLNIWSQCHKCNCHLSANLTPYRVNLINKIGLEKVEWLESQTQTRKYTVEYLQRITKVFRKKIKLIESRL